MPYDYYLESENEQRMFTPKTWKEMQEYIIKFPHYKANERLFYIFKDNEWRDVAIPGIVSSISKKENIYIYPCIGYTTTSILVSVVGDKDVDRYLHDFVVWCQKRYPCQLYEGSEVIAPEELFLFEDDENYISSME